MRHAHNTIVMTDPWMIGGIVLAAIVAFAVDIWLIIIDMLPGELDAMETE